MRFKKRDENILNYARKVSLVVPEDDARVLDGQSKICNWLKNRLKDEVEDRIKLLADIPKPAQGEEPSDQAKELLQAISTAQGLRNLVPELKEQFPFLKVVHSSPLKNIALRVADTIDRFQKSKRKQGKAAAHSQWLAYSSWKRDWTSLEYEEPNKGWNVEEFGWLRLSLGANAEGRRLAVRLKLVDPPKHMARARSCRIIREGRDRYYAVFTFKRKKEAIEDGDRFVYLDPNHKNFAYGVDNSGNAFEIANLSKLAAAEKSLDKLKGYRDKCKKKSLWVDTVRNDGTVGTHWHPSRKWQRYQNAVTRLESKVRDQKKHFMYSLANRLMREYDVIGIGDYVPASADHGKGAVYNRAVVNRTFHGRFKRILTWVGQRSRKRVLVMDETGTTRTCHCCGHAVEGGIHPEIREWTCPQCLSVHIRDENACQNGLQRLASQMASEADCPHLPCLGHQSVVRRCNWRFSAQGWEGVPKRRRQSKLNAPTKLSGGDPSPRRDGRQPKRS